MYGRSNTGKSQLAMQAALEAARSEARTLFVDTEGSFRPERLQQMAEARGWGSERMLERVVYFRSDSYSEQMEAIRRMKGRSITSSSRLVVIDTLTRNFSLELPGRSNMMSRQAALDVHLSEMARDAYLNGRAYLLTNRVTFGATHDVGIGGSTVRQLVHASVLLEREGRSVRAKSPPSSEGTLLGLGFGGVD